MRAVELALLRRPADTGGAALGNPGESALVRVGPGKLAVVGGAPATGHVALVDVTTALSVIGPLLMNFLLVRWSGKALLERKLGRSKPGYADYVARTSGFFPRPPRRG